MPVGQPGNTFCWSPNPPFLLLWVWKLPYQPGNQDLLCFFLFLNFFFVIFLNSSFPSFYSFPPFFGGATQTTKRAKVNKHQGKVVRQRNNILESAIKARYLRLRYTITGTKKKKELVLKLDVWEAADVYF